MKVTKSSMRTLPAQSTSIAAHAEYMSASERLVGDILNVRRNEILTSSSCRRPVPSRSKRANKEVRYRPPIVLGISFLSFIRIQFTASSVIGGPLLLNTVNKFPPGNIFCWSAFLGDISEPYAELPVDAAKFRGVIALCCEAADSNPIKPLKSRMPIRPKSWSPTAAHNSSSSKSDTTDGEILKYLRKARLRSSRFMHPDLSWSSRLNKTSS
mmetsp:Transcript_89769/g.141755  ORF Transcript_89769/g.141755 Transcript_89769/m.141755 type:complete len:212 (-) Transcript_89769:931-1566(-)